MVYDGHSVSDRWHLSMVRKLCGCETVNLALYSKSESGCILICLSYCKYLYCFEIFGDGIAIFQCQGEGPMKI